MYLRNVSSSCHESWYIHVYIYVQGTTHGDCHHKHKHVHKQHQIPSGDKFINKPNVYTYIVMLAVVVMKVGMCKSMSPTYHKHDRVFRGCEGGGIPPPPPLKMVLPRGGRTRSCG